MSALAVAVPLMCVPFILRIAGPTNGMGAPFIVPSIAEIPCGKPSTRILPSPPAPPSPLARPGPPADPTAIVKLLHLHFLLLHHHQSFQHHHHLHLQMLLVFQKLQNHLSRKL